MGQAHAKELFEKSQQPKEAEARKNRAVSWLNGDAQPLNNVENLLVRARVDLGELKRTGSRQGLPELMADVAELKSEIEQLEHLLNKASTAK
jgi:hypothetical protein